MRNILSFYFWKVKILDLNYTNSGQTLNKMINNTYRIYTAYKNDSILVNFGDSQSRIYQLNSGIKDK